MAGEQMNALGKRPMIRHTALSLTPIAAAVSVHSPLFVAPLGATNPDDGRSSPATRALSLLFPPLDTFSRPLETTTTTTTEPIGASSDLTHIALDVLLLFATTCFASNVLPEPRIPPRSPYSPSCVPLPAKDMPLLGGLFARNSNGNGATTKSKNAGDLSPSATDSYSASFRSNLSPPPSSQTSPTSEYVSFHPGPSSPNGRSLAYAGEPQKDKRGLGFFGRKRSTSGMLNVDTDMRLQGPRPSYLGRLSTSSDVPPSDSSASPNSLRPPQNMYTSSTRSLPPPLTTAGSSPYAHHSPSNTPQRDRQYSSLSPLGPQISPTRSTASGWTAASGKTSKSTGVKSGRKFAFWSRGDKNKDKEPPELPPLPPSSSSSRPPSDFNLRSFRHVRAERDSPTPSPKPHPLTATNLSSLSHQIDREGGAGAGALGSAYEYDHLPPARPRPRGGSDASASSSRISVAAFREVQARRSAADSPIMGESASARAPSPGPYGRAQQQQRRPEASPVQRAPQPPPKKTPSSAITTTAKTKPTTGHRRTANAAKWDSDDDDDEEEEEEEEDSSDDPRSRKPIASSRSESGHGLGPSQGRSQSSLGVYGYGGKKGGSTGNLVGSASGSNVAGACFYLSGFGTCADDLFFLSSSLPPHRPLRPRLLDSI
ncbi:hypothetical protein C8F01DRAFT_1264776 [Mycena amicta]|nr:hypothetical protein C8F01DRAFT_1264776 [Mycena amicta]